MKVSQNGLELINCSITDKSKNKVITDTIQSFKTVKELYMSLYNTVEDNLLKYLHNCLILEQEKLCKNFKLNAFKFLNCQNNFNSKKVINTYNVFFHRFGRFPGDLDLVKVPQGEIPKFLKTADIIFPVALYEKFSIGETRELVYMQLMSVLNIFLGGDSKISKDAICEIFHNLLMQTLSKSDGSVLIKFDSIGLLLKNINEIFQKNVF